MLLLISLTVTAVLASCGELSQEQSQQVDEALKDSLTSTTETWDLDMEIMEEGIKKLELWGAYAATITEEGKNKTKIRGPVTIHVFDTTGTVETKVFSNRAVYQPNEAIFELYGNVRVNTADNRHLQSEYLKWKQNDNKISTPQFVIIQTPSDSIAGTGFEGNTDLSDYSIKEPKGKVIVN